MSELVEAAYGASSLLALPSTMTGLYTRPLSRLYHITASKGIGGCFSFPARPPINPVAEYLAAVLCFPLCSSRLWGEQRLHRNLQEPDRIRNIKKVGLRSGIGQLAASRYRILLACGDDSCSSRPRQSHRTQNFRDEARDQRGMSLLFCRLQL